MTLAQIIARKWIKPGMDRMIAEGSIDVANAKDKAWRSWLDRRDAALAKGETFTEPAPDESGRPPTTPQAGG